MTAPHLIVPGPLSTPTGGFVYDRRIAEGMRARGRDILVHELPTGWPAPDLDAQARAAALFEGLPQGATVVVDGLALGALPEIAARHAVRLRLIALVHHPLAAETGLSPEERRVLGESERRALSRVRHVITTSAFTADALLDYGVTAPHMTVIPPGVASARLALGSGGGPGGMGLSMLSVGALTPRKGHDVLLNALAGLTQYDWRLDVVGSEVLQPQHATGIRRLADRLGLTGRVRFHGELTGEALDAAYHTADLFVLASHYEGYGMVLTEAVARGLPVVATAGGAVPFTLPEGSGLLSPPGDVDRLRQILARLMTESDLRRRLERGARQAARTLPTWDDVIDRVSLTLDEVAR
jgi:glycosyltransferase involved in cell wall biosynthesis